MPYHTFCMLTLLSAIITLNGQPDNTELQLKNEELVEIIKDMMSYTRANTLVLVFDSSKWVYLTSIAQESKQRFFSKVDSYLFIEIIVAFEQFAFMFAEDMHQYVVRRLLQSFTWVTVIRMEEVETLSCLSHLHWIDVFAVVLTESSQVLYFIRKVSSTLLIYRKYPTIYHFPNNYENLCYSLCKAFI